MSNKKTRCSNLLFLTAVAFGSFMSPKKCINQVVDDAILTRRKKMHSLTALLMIDPKPQVENAVDVSSYGDLGGTVQSLRYEMHMKHLHPDGTDRLSMKSFEAFLNDDSGTSSELYSTFFQRPE